MVAELNTKNRSKISADFFILVLGILYAETQMLIINI